jgi:FtsP/CotA-like multicopper oxidase with cupredoxin domain
MEIAMPRLTRRAFLAASAAAALPRATRAETLETEVVAAPAEVQLVPPEYGATKVWAYDGAAPGAGLRLPQGTRLVRSLVNDLPQPTTIHWHGIRLPNAMDGVAHLTQEAVPPGRRFRYEFALPDAGTYWYHPHHNSVEQVGRGLAAPLIVEEAEPPEVDADLAFTISDWRLDPDAQIMDDFGNLHDAAHAGRLGNWLTVNGLAEVVHPSPRHARLRLRLINAATDRILRVAAEGLDGHVMALDGMPLAAAEPFAALLLGPAQRADLFLDVTAETGETAHLLSEERDGSYALASFPVEPGTAARRPAPAPLPPNRLEPLALDSARDVPLVMEGGAMSPMMMGGMMGGGRGAVREAMSRGLVWALNGGLGMPEAPLLEAARGETVRLRIANRTAFPHAMHLHGHHFHELAEAGPGPARDTILVTPDAETEIAFVADNPGDWMFHCHMLSHQAAGMMTWLRVA